MRTTTVAGRTWHYSHYLGRQTAEHNESRCGRTGGYIFPMDVAFGADDLLFAVSRGLGYGYDGYIGDIGCRIGKTTIGEDHLGDFARAGFTWPAGRALLRPKTTYIVELHSRSGIKTKRVTFEAIDNRRQPRMILIRLD